MNLVKRWFRDSTDKRLRRGTFRSVLQLIAAMEDYIEHLNNEGKGFHWTAKAEAILEKVLKYSLRCQINCADRSPMMGKECPRQIEDFGLSPNYLSWFNPTVKSAYLEIQALGV